MQTYLPYSEEERRQLDGRFNPGKKVIKKIDGKYSKEDWNEKIRRYREKKRMLGLVGYVKNKPLVKSVDKVK